MGIFFGHPTGCIIYWRRIVLKLPLDCKNWLPHLVFRKRFWFWFCLRSYVIDHINIKTPALRTSKLALADLWPSSWRVLAQFAHGLNESKVPKRDEGWALRALYFHQRVHGTLAATFFGKTEGNSAVVEDFRPGDEYAHRNFMWGETLKKSPPGRGFSVQRVLLNEAVQIIAMLQQQWQNMTK